MLITVPRSLRSFKTSQTAIEKYEQTLACADMRGRKYAHPKRQAGERSLKTSCLEGIGDVMMEIREDKEAGAQMMRAARAGGMLSV